MSGTTAYYPRQNKDGDLRMEVFVHAIGHINTDTAEDAVRILDTVYRWVKTGEVS
ncbi:hypothetical protein J4U02_gp061 [Mycobacterium phage Aziz]|uniref:Uncharacterized protein n=1 Tax=Mycobacterium phage Aziz TaxID=2762281 RepID=A0A7G8LHJ9_9CAUD|nr:hypothetical protein J4U02_gp061 [Mycobacterium phage Aziz]ASR75908.1 hypothetical protein SEA_GENEVAB15_61 [Mycobacterium phage GenevaB15]QNJ56721.1 hypothetical protein SEA_AZIZ_61 [Mycobacterium phage Aziz]